MRITLSLSEDLVSMKEALLGNMANSLTQINASASLIQLGMNGSAEPCQKLVEGLESLNLDVQAFGEQVLDAAVEETQEFNDSLRNDGDESSLGDQALTGWEEAAKEAQTELDAEITKVEEIISNVGEKGFVVDQGWLDELHCLELTVATIAEEFPMEITLEAAALVG